MSERRNLRCPLCRALVVEDAEWCGQCFASLPGRARRPAVPVVPDARPRAEPEERHEPASVDELRLMSREFEAVSEVALGAAAGPTPAGPNGAALRQRLRVPGPGDSLHGGTEAEDLAAASVVHPVLGVPAWKCPACGEQNRMELELCGVCATPFKRLFQGPETQKTLEPRSAAISSMLLPGVGHIRLGRVADGVARAILFLWSVGTAILVMLAGAPPGVGALGPMVLAFLAAGAGIYGFSAVDAYRLADGRDQVLSSRFLLYGSAALVMLSVLSLGVLAVKFAPTP